MIALNPRRIFENGGNMPDPIYVRTFFSIVLLTLLIVIVLAGLYIGGEKPRRG